MSIEGGKYRDEELIQTVRDLGIPNEQLDEALKILQQSNENARTRSEVSALMFFRDKKEETEQQ